MYYSGDICTVFRGGSNWFVTSRELRSVDEETGQARCAKSTCLCSRVACFTMLY